MRRGAADSSAVAARAVLQWRRSEACLAPIIGHAGYLAIYRRSLALARPAFRWLPLPTDSTHGSTARAQLHAALIGQTGQESSAGDAALRRAFGDLLGSLVGGRLATRLLELRRIGGQAETAA